jgi:hypothetical protein
MQQFLLRILNQAWCKLQNSLLWCLSPTAAAVPLLCYVDNPPWHCWPRQGQAAVVCACVAGLALWTGWQGVSSYCRVVFQKLKCYIQLRDNLL